jgi:hypothetical protein
MSYDCSCDYDPADIYRAAKPKARRPHKCEECSGPILPGEQYERVFGVWEGYASTFKTCARCLKTTSHAFVGRTAICLRTPRSASRKPVGAPMMRFAELSLAS